MQDTDGIDKGKLELTKLEILLIELGIISTLKDLKHFRIRFNNRPFSDPNHLHIKQTKLITKKDNFIDLHLEIVKKIDEVIQRHNQELTTSMVEPMTTSISHKLTLSEPIDFRPPTIRPEIRRPEPPRFESFIHFERVFETQLVSDVLNVPRGDLFEIVPQEQITPTTEPIDEEFQSKMFGTEDVKTHKWFWGATKIKVKLGKEKHQEQPKEGKVNGVTKTKIEIEETKKEIEERKKALEDAIRKEKEKELELKKQKEEKEKIEKMTKKELKQKLKEEKIQMKLDKKLAKQKEKEMKALEKQKQKEETPIKPPQRPEHLPWEKPQTDTFFDEDVEKLLPVLDSLLEKLPEDVIDRFANSDDFRLYEKVINKYKNK